MNELTLGLVLIFLQHCLDHSSVEGGKSHPKAAPSQREVLKARKSLGRKWLGEALKPLSVLPKPQIAKQPENGMTRGFLGKVPVPAVKVAAGLLAAFQLRWFLPSGI